MTTRIKPRQNANTVDEPTMPMTIRSNALIAQWTASSCRHYAVIPRRIELRQLRVGNFACRVRTDAHPSHGALLRLQRLGVCGKSRRLDLGHKRGCRFPTDKPAQLDDKTARR